MKIDSTTRVGVLGLGVSGMSGVRFLLDKGAKIFVSDFGSRDRYDEAVLADLAEKGVEFEFDGHSVAFLQQADLILAGPGVPLNSPLMEEIRRSGKDVVGELAIVAGEITEPVVAITGTNGKSTVTDLIEMVLSHSGKRTFKGGNLGTPVYDSCLEKEKYDALVLEVSSFQLDLSGAFRPNIGIWLNLTPDHLDRHGSIDGYKAAKMKLFRNQGKADVAILNDDDPFCTSCYADLGGRKLLTFGHDKSCSAVINPADKTVTLTEEDEIYRLASTNLESLTGLMNSAAAVLAAKELGCSQKYVQEALEAYRPLRHRIEFVRELNGVRYYDDSKATNSGAVVAALSGTADKSVHLIAGGRDKGDDYSLMRSLVRAKVKQLILIGEAVELIAEALEGCVPMVRAVDMNDAVSKASEKSRCGDIVLLSPACASFDMFKNYGERGQAFIDAVHSLGDK